MTDLRLSTTTLDDRLRSLLPARVRAPLRAISSAVRQRVKGPPVPSLLMWHRSDTELAAQPLPAAASRAARSG